MDLTTLLILGDFVSNVSTLLISALFISVGFFVITTIIYLINVYEAEMCDNSKQGHTQVVKTCRFILHIAGAIIVISACIKSILPAQKTIYIVAGLKASENIINSELGKKTQQLIMDKIENYLKETK